MFKRLSISLLLMGLAAFSLGAAAFAWFSTSETGNVSITSGSADISIDVDIDCNGSVDDTVDGAPYAFNWTNIVPGDSTRDCFTVYNTGNGELEVFVQHSGISGFLKDVLQFTYDEDADPLNGDRCGPNIPEAAGFTTANSSRGCNLGLAPAGGSLAFEARVLFPYTNSDQNNAQGRVLNMVSTVTGYTTP